MSTTFSFSRLGKLITKQFFENSRFYLFCALALVGLLALVFAFWIVAAGPNYHEEETYVIFIFGLYIAGTVFSGMSFNMLGSKDKGIYWLGVPATHLEKLACTIFYSTVLFTLFYCLSFYIVKSIGLVFLTDYLRIHPGTFIEMKDFNHGFGEAFPYFVYAYFAVQALYLLGSVYFTRYSFVITTVVVASLIFVFTYYISRLQNNVLGRVQWDLISIKTADHSNGNGYKFYSLPSAITNILKYATMFAWAPLFWIVTWFRLKEKEI